MLFTEAIGRQKPIERISRIRTVQNGGGEFMEYLPYIYHPKIDTEHEKSYQKVKTQTFAHDNKNKIQNNVKLKETVLQLAFR